MAIIHHSAEDTLTFRATWHNQPPAELLTQTGEWLEDKNPVLALAYFEAALDIDPTYSLAAWRFGSLALQQGHCATARDKLEESLDMTPDHAPTHFCLSAVYTKLDQLERALECVEQALQITPLHSGAFLQKVRLLARLQRWQELQQLLTNPIPNLESATELSLYRVLSLAKLGCKENARSEFHKLSSKKHQKFPDLFAAIESTLS
jgi:tetratricopeptide (TPR) repeat protein